MKPIAMLLFFLLSSTAVFAQQDYPLREDPIDADDRQHWAFQPITHPTIPEIRNKKQARNPIDHFILAKLEAKGLQPMPEANRVTLIRRLSFDLTGLPPTAKEVAAFVNDTSTDAYEKLVDRLLASETYGERWAQHWLDLARFAETDGFEHDKIRKEAWRYRDWVIAALNKDMPYDEFVRLQIAGDEWQPDKSASHVATGFLTSGPDMPDINSQKERHHVVLNEMTSTVSAVFLGLTMECAQCHNHKYDPISQADFYRMRAIFANVIPKLKRYQQLPAKVKESTPDVAPAHFIIRGNFNRIGPVLQPAFPRIANAGNRKVSQPDKKDRSSMRRTALARWLTDPSNPLTARVMVNRVWMHHFGKGLSNTPSDFGFMGEEPTHPKLLDWLAADFVRQKWSLKKLHKRIVTSAAYRRASMPTDSSWSKETQTAAREIWQTARAKDSANELLWKRDRIRLDGEAIRDAMLSVADKLSDRKGGAGVRPPLPKELVSTLLKGQWDVSPNKADHYRRSIYLFVRRNLRFPIFEAFDRPDGNATCPRRSKSTTAPQALVLLNSEFSRQMADIVAGHVRKQTTEPRDRVRMCFRKILSREPTEFETNTGLTFLREQAKRIGAGDGPTDAALADFCLALFNVNEFVYAD